LNASEKDLNYTYQNYGSIIVKPVLPHSIVGESNYLHSKCEISGHMLMFLSRYGRKSMRQFTLLEERETPEGRFMPITTI
jgi:hypothetical protein